VKSIGRNAGLENLRVATYPGVISTHAEATVVKNVEESVADQIVEQLTQHEPTRRLSEACPADRDIVFRGSYEDVNRFFYDNTWTDGLPIVPPTVEKVEAFLEFTDRSPDEVLGAMHPSQSEASIWKVAVNGVMAGCRPEYMPILIAIVEVMADPQYAVKHGGSTPGWEAMIILNGPISDQLGFNRGIGVQRPGNQANTSIGRFYRLFCRNVLRFLPGGTDMATFGQMFRAVLPENDQACIDIGWQPLHVMRGYNREDSVVTLTSVRAVSDPFSTAGENADRHIEYILDWVMRMIQPYEASEGYVETNVLLLTPVIASVIAKGGYSKQQLNDVIMQRAMVTAREFERLMTLGTAHPPGTTLKQLVASGHMPSEWAESDDPGRLVPLMLPETKWLVVVTGDPTRNRCCVFRQNFKQGYATSRKIALPKRWDALLAAAKKICPIPKSGNRAARSARRRVAPGTGRDYNPLSAHKA
jgi:hypothetical protein